MFAPPDHTPLATLWSQFLSARFDAAYHSASAFYADPESETAYARGSPLDIAEYVFLNLMWQCAPLVVSTEGAPFSIYTTIEDGKTGLFTKIPPKQSVLYLAAGEVEGESDKERHEIAGPFFASLEFETDERRLWQERYPVLEREGGGLLDEDIENVRFHSLPIGFTRERFTIVEQLPYWSKFIDDIQMVKSLVDEFPGRPLCISNAKLEGWNDILNGKTPLFDGDESVLAATPNKAGRPALVPLAKQFFLTTYSQGRTVPWKEVRRSFRDKFGRDVSESTLRRAGMEVWGSASD